MFRFLLSFLAGFGLVFIALKVFFNKKEKQVKEEGLQFPPEPKFEDTEKLFNIFKEFQKAKNNI